MLGNRHFWNTTLQGGVERCIRVLETCLDEQDWSLACLVCQALWNYCIDSNNITESIVDEECLCNLEGKIFLLCHLYQYLFILSRGSIFYIKQEVLCFRHSGLPPWVLQWSDSAKITIRRFTISRSPTITRVRRKRILQGWVSFKTTIQYIHIENCPYNRQNGGISIVAFTFRSVFAF